MLCSVVFPVYLKREASVLGHGVEDADGSQRQRHVHHRLRRGLGHEGLEAGSSRGEGCVV